MFTFEIEFHGDIGERRWQLGAALFDRGENIRDHFRARFGAEIAFAVDADADGVRLPCRGCR